MIDKCIDYLNDNGYYGNISMTRVNYIAFKAAEQLCNDFNDKDGGEVPDDVFNVVMDLIGGEL